MLSNDEIADLIDTILKRGDRAYTTESGAFLELLRNFAQDNKISQIAEACTYYVQTYPSTAPFISAQVPPILVNSCLPHLTDFPYNSFIEWSLITPNWAESLKNTFTNPKLFKIAFDNLIENVRRFSAE